MNTSTLVNAFLDAKEDLSTVDQYRQTLNLLIDGVPDLPGTPEQVRKVLKSASTLWVKYHWWCVFRIFYRWCHLKYHLDNIMDFIDRPRVPEVELRYLSRLEMSRVLAAAGSPLERGIISLGIDVGVRASEFGRIQVRDVSPDMLLIHGKGNRHLRVPILRESYNILCDLINTLPQIKPAKLVFTNGRDCPISRFTVYRIVRKCMERAGVPGPKMGSHTLRHSLGTNYINNGGDPYTLQRIMRHRSMNTTNKYVHISLAKVIQSHRQYSPLKDAMLGAQGLLFKTDILEEAESLIKR